MKRIALIVLLMAVMACFARTQLLALDDQYYPIMKADEDMRSMKSEKNMVSSGFQYGVWITPVILYQNSRGNESVTSVNTFRVWLKSYLWNNSYIYARAKDTYSAYLYHKGSGSYDDKNVVDLDLGYIAMATPRKEFEFTVGRKYFVLGTGTVLDGRGDGAEIDVNTKYLSIQALGLWTGWLAKDDNPYGLSDRDISTGAKRVFAGGKLSTSFYNQTLYGFGLAQFDFGKEQYDYKKFLLGYLLGSTGIMEYYNMKTRYQSQYYGAGLEGVIASGVTYSGEFIAEMGKSYSYDPLLAYTRSQKDILAFAGLAKIEYYIDVLLKPVLSAQYSFGSGDTNRDDYRQPTGNRYGSDSGFLYFGTFVGGYALKPVLANLHVIGASAALSPFSWSSTYSLRNMTLIARYQYYLKNKAQAAINDGLDATRAKREVGHGLDISLRWQIFSDFSFFTNYGLFLPGEAFGSSYRFQYTLSSGGVAPVPFNSSKNNRHFVMTGFNISF
jgi:hypothetical protein